MFERHPGAARELLGNAIYLENSGTEVASLNIWGSPVQPEFNNWAFNVARGAAIRRYWEMIPDNTNILVTHGPPFGMLDKLHPSTPHLGCEELAKAVEQIKPRLHIFGHIHGGHGLLTANGMCFVNASVVNEEYRLVHESQVVEIEVSPEQAPPILCIR
jgi:Icc-related predicted phosphoesterase